MLLAPRPLKARGDRIGVGLDAPVAERRQALWVTLAADDRAQDALAGQSVMLAITESSLTFISVSAFCMCRTQRERSPVSRLIWRA